nr:ribonuclease HI [Maliibacterium massiliense]
MKEVTIYTDGACSGNPGQGGWGAILLYRQHRRELSGYAQQTTNNRMELYAPLQAFKALSEPCVVDVYSDSAYLVNAFNQHWIDNWQRNAWKTASKQPVENQDLWKALLEAIAPHRVTWHKVKGHADNALNNRCDELARQQIKRKGETFTNSGQDM